MDEIHHSMGGLIQSKVTSLCKSSELRTTPCLVQAFHSLLNCEQEVLRSSAVDLYKKRFTYFLASWFLASCMHVYKMKNVIQGDHVYLLIYSHVLSQKYILDLRLWSFEIWHYVIQVDRYQHSQEHAATFFGVTKNTETLGSSEMLLPIYQTTRCHIPEELILKLTAPTT
jgi:hypothetical protein